MKANLVILDAFVVTMDISNPYAEAIAIDGNQIIAVGSNADIVNFIDSKTKVINADKKVVLPGFIDCHVHLMQTGLDMMKLDSSTCNNKEILKASISKQVKNSLADQWIMVTGYNEFEYKEHEKITLKELDVIAPNNPVWISRVDHHSGIFNSMAFNLLSIPEEIDGIDLDDRDNTFTGFAFGDANSYIRQSLSKNLDNMTRKQALKKASEKMLSVGITSVHALEGGSLFSDDDVDVILDEIPNLPIGIKLFYQTTDIKKVLDRGLKQIGGCLLIDGSIGSRTAALSQPYADDSRKRGILYFDTKELEDFVIEAHNKELQITVHAIGDAAIEQILKAYEKALTLNPRYDHRHRIEHFSLPTSSQIERCIKQNIILSIQPAWSKPSSLTEIVGPTRLGDNRANRLYPIATAFLGGARMCAGSDSPISQVGPLLGIHGGVNHFRLYERLSVMSLISLYTTKAAWAGFEEKIKGMLKPGYIADIVILNDNIFEMEIKKISDIRINKTIAQGKVKYDLEDSNYN